MADSPSRPSHVRLVVAILVAALLAAGLIVFATQQPDECEEWNDDVRVVVRRVVSIRGSAPGTVSIEEIQDVQSDMRAVLAQKPNEDCELDEDTEDTLDVPGA